MRFCEILDEHDDEASIHSHLMNAIQGERSLFPDIFDL